MPPTPRNPNNDDGTYCLVLDRKLAATILALAAHHCCPPDVIVRWCVEALYRATDDKRALHPPKVDRAIQATRIGKLTASAARTLRRRFESVR